MMSSSIRLPKTFFAFIFPALTACSDNKTESVTTTMSFEPCAISPTLDCGAFEVPLIHGSTDNRIITIDVAQLTATGDGPHEPLVINFGGPGSGIEILQEIAQLNVLPASIRERYDIIGFEQRGVASPLRIDCDQLGNIETSPYPRDENDLQAIVNDSIMLADACSAEYTDQLQWVGSNAVVQDMDIMRTRLGADKLNIIGISFGSRITALYLERYPENSGRIVLDAPLRPNGKLESLLLGTVEAEQRSFELMLNTCGTTLPDCDRSAVEAAFVSRLNNLLDNGENDTANAFYNLLAIAIEEADTQEFLAPLLIEYAFSGDATEMLELVRELDFEDDRDQDDASDTNNSITLEKAVLCADDAQRPNINSLVSLLNDLNVSSDLFAEAIIPLAATCAGWPEALNPVADIQTSDAPVSLVVGGSGDVRTPVKWSREMAEAVGGVFLLSNHPGHTIVFTRQNECVDSIVTDFLLDGELPAEGTTCN